MKRLRQINENLANTQEELLQRLFHSDLFTINAINKAVNRDILSMAYSPGVGSICMNIVENPSSINHLTLRGRSVAIVSDGSLLQIRNERFLPVMDWFIAQIKFYAGIDAFPFLIRQ